MSTDILVTGSNGLIGTAVKALCPKAFFVTRQDGDLTDLGAARRLFETCRPKRVIHLAAEVGGVKSNARKNSDLFSSNVQINTNVLTAAHEFGVSRLVSVLSSCSFQMYEDRSSREEDLHLGLPFEGNRGYAYSKRMLDVHTKLLFEQYRKEFSSITPVSVYGPNDNWDLDEGHVVGSLIHKCFLAKEGSQPLEVWGSGKAMRQFVFAQDVARLLLEELEFFRGPETMIVAPDQGISIAETAEYVAQAMDFQGPIVFNDREPEGQVKKVIESKHFSRLFPDFEFTSLKEGLERTTEWFYAHQPVADFR
jgi:GDP-L-fucose synthase